MCKYDYRIDTTNANMSATLILKWIKPGSRVLEIGTATGYMTRYLSEELQCDVTGIEIDPEAAAKASSYCNRLLIGDVELMDLDSELGTTTFDHIIFADVLEHLRDPWRVLKKVCQWLDKSGTALISVPNIGHASIVLELMEGRFHYRELGLLDSTHLRFFTKEGVIGLLSGAGLVPVEWTGTIRGPEDTEFNNSYDKYPRSVQEVLQRIPNGHVYQFVCAARRATEYEINNITNNVPDLRDSGYNYGDYVTVKKNSTSSKFHLRTDGVISSKTIEVTASDLRHGVRIIFRTRLLVFELLAVTINSCSGYNEEISSGQLRRIITDKDSIAVINEDGQDRLLILADGAYLVLRTHSGEDTSRITITYRANELPSQGLCSLIESLKVQLHSQETRFTEERDRLNSTILSLQEQVSLQEKEIRGLHAVNAQLNDQLQAVLGTISWRVTKPLRFASQLKRKTLSWIRRYYRDNMGNSVQFAESYSNGEWSSQEWLRRIRENILTDAAKALPTHSKTADIIICVHNALEDVKLCIESVLDNTSPPFNLIIVDDGSDEPTRLYLESVSARHSIIRLIRNDSAKGYTRAANQGLRESKGDYTVLLNSDTVVTTHWLDRMIACAESDPGIGIVGPLSNTASWQSIPKIECGGDWAANELPPGVSVNDMAELVAKYSAHLYPRVHFLNGFCLLIKRAVIAGIGYFDEHSFGEGYGEENDYCLRARNVGWELAVADNVFIFHTQSKSYSHGRRKRLSESADRALRAKHGDEIVDAGVEQCKTNKVLAGIRARSAVMLEREQCIRDARGRWIGKKILFILPVASIGGGANVVIQELDSMRRMGVEAAIGNLLPHRETFERDYPEIDIPVLYLNHPEQLHELSRGFDAVVATANYSVQWLCYVDNHKILGYYIQDFEPYFYPEGSAGYIEAWKSYTLLPNMKCFTKTDWNRIEVKRNIGVDCCVVGPSVNIDLFRPRPRIYDRLSTGKRKVLVGAMVRPSSPRRGPLTTMRVLEKAWKVFGKEIEIILFGCEPTDPEFIALPRDFAHTNLGVLTREELAWLLNELDIFVDFSTYQAMGLTAMEAMACGVSVAAPVFGGTSSYLENGYNGLLVDTASEVACFDALKNLIEDHDLRRRLETNALVDICSYYPEKAAWNILQVLFGA
ncbi:MAG: glycosyltransferase [Alicyclobacillus sp.]|nr:glycosyltransferase [Alicyclobacillus sp.]